MTSHNLYRYNKEKLFQFMRNISMLRAIQAFEAAARKENYAEAAAELNVTAAAIGQQVRALEAWLQLPLFRRLGSGTNRLVLTDAAADALPEFKEGLDRLDAGLRRLRQRHQRATVTVSASQAFVARWLMPRLERFTDGHPDIDVRLDVSDRLADVQRGEADLAIRCGAGRWSGLKAIKLFDEEVFPVCSPSLLAGKAPPRTAAQLAAITLIHDLTLAPSQVFPSWERWLAEQGVKPPKSARGFHINSSAAAIQAALNGQGVALARRLFVQDDLAQARLLRLLPKVSWPIAWAYYCVHTDTGMQRGASRAFADWLIAESTRATA